MASSRFLFSAIVTDIIDNKVTYPSCIQCYSKVEETRLRSQLQWKCLKCGRRYKPEEVRYRYRLNLTVCNGSAYFDITAFGAMLDNFFGLSASLFFSRYQSRLLQKFGIWSNQLLNFALEKAFVGETYIFGVKLPAGLQDSDVAPNFAYGIRCASNTTSSQLHTTLNTSVQRNDLNKLIATQMMLQSTLKPAKSVAQVIDHLELVLKNKGIDCESDIAHLGESDFVGLINSCEGTHRNMNLIGPADQWHEYERNKSSHEDSTMSSVGSGLSIHLSLDNSVSFADSIKGGENKGEVVGTCVDEDKVADCSYSALSKTISLENCCSQGIIKQNMHKENSAHFERTKLLSTLNIPVSVIDDGENSSFRPRKSLKPSKNHNASDIGIGKENEHPASGKPPCDENKNFSANSAKTVNSQLLEQTCCLETKGKKSNSHRKRLKKKNLTWSASRYLKKMEKLSDEQSIISENQAVGQNSLSAENVSVSAKALKIDSVNSKKALAFLDSSVELPRNCHGKETCDGKMNQYINDSLQLQHCEDQNASFSLHSEDFDSEISEVKVDTKVNTNAEKNISFDMKNFKNCTQDIFQSASDSIKFSPSLPSFSLTSADFDSEFSIPDPENLSKLINNYDKVTENSCDDERKSIGKDQRNSDGLCCNNTEKLSQVNQYDRMSNEVQGAKTLPPNASEYDMPESEDFELFLCQPNVISVNECTDQERLEHGCRSQIDTLVQGCIYGSAHRQTDDSAAFTKMHALEMPVNLTVQESQTLPLNALEDDMPESEDFKFFLCKLKAVSVNEHTDHERNKHVGRSETETCPQGYKYGSKHIDDSKALREEHALEMSVNVTVRRSKRLQNKNMKSCGNHTGISHSSKNSEIDSVQPNATATENKHSFQKDKNSTDQKHKSSLFKHENRNGLDTSKALRLDKQLTTSTSTTKAIHDCSTNLKLKDNVTKLQSPLRCYSFKPVDNFCLSLNTEDQEFPESEDMWAFLENSFQDPQTSHKKSEKEVPVVLQQEISYPCTSRQDSYLKSLPEMNSFEEKNCPHETKSIENKPKEEEEKECRDLKNVASSFCDSEDLFAELPMCQSNVQEKENLEQASSLSYTDFQAATSFHATSNKSATNHTAPIYSNASSSNSGNNYTTDHQPATYSNVFGKNSASIFKRTTEQGSLNKEFSTSSSSQPPASNCCLNLEAWPKTCTEWNPTEKSLSQDCFLDDSVDLFCSQSQEEYTETESTPLSNESDRAPSFLNVAPDKSDEKIPDELLMPPPSTPKIREKGRIHSKKSILIKRKVRFSGNFQEHIFNESQALCDSDKITCTPNSQVAVTELKSCLKSNVPTITPTSSDQLFSSDSEELFFSQCNFVASSPSEVATSPHNSSQDEDERLSMIVSSASFELFSDSEEDSPIPSSIPQKTLIKRDTECNTRQTKPLKASIGQVLKINIVSAQKSENNGLNVTQGSKEDFSQEFNLSVDGSQDLFV